MVQFGDLLHVTFLAGGLFVCQQVFHLGEGQLRKAQPRFLNAVVEAPFQDVAVAISIRAEVSARSAVSDGR